MFSRRLAPVAVIVAALAMGYRTWLRNPDWATTPILLFSMIRDHPESYRAQWVHAIWMWQRGELDKARYHWELAYRIYPRDSQFLAEYGNFLMSDGKNDRAIAILEESFRMHNYVPRTAGYLAYAYLIARRYGDALRMAQHARRIGGDASSMLPIIAYAYDGLGDRNRAIAAWRVTLRETHMENWGAWSFLARTLALSGFEEEALTAVSRARPLARDSASAVTVARLDAAIRTGCYRAAAPADTANGAPAAIPLCDPLGPALAAAAVQNANPLQNAMPVATPGPLPVRPGGS
jgi:Tfp pilus assembly protein PilF